MNPGLWLGWLVAGPWPVGSGVRCDDHGPVWCLLLSAVRCHGLDCSLLLRVGAMVTSGRWPLAQTPPMGTIPAMPQFLARVVLHVVFSTKNRVPFLKDHEVSTRLHAYMAGVLQAIGCEPILINGVEDHVHILCNLSRTITIAGLVEEAKKSPSKWMKEQGAAYRDFFWQGGYGAFSVSQSNVEQVRAYVASQEKHHRKVSFQDEFRALCRKHGVEIDERYVWD